MATLRRVTWRSPKRGTLMARTLTPFEERLYTEYDLKKRVELCIVLSMILFVAFILLDWVYTPQFLGTFAIIRVAVAALAGVLLVLARRTESNRVMLDLAMAIVLL